LAQAILAQDVSFRWLAATTNMRLSSVPVGMHFRLGRIGDGRSSQEAKCASAR